MGRLPNGELPLAAQVSFVAELEQLEKELDRAPVKKHHKDLNFLIESDPQAYKGLVDRLSSGQSINKICRETGFQSDIVRKIAKAHPASIDARRSAIVDLLEEAIHSTVERLAEENDEIGVSRLAEVLKETVKNYQLLRGEATARTETRSVASPEDLQKMFEALPQAKVIDGTDKSITVGSS